MAVIKSKPFFNNRVRIQKSTFLNKEKYYLLTGEREREREL